MSTRVILADDQKMMREGLRLILDQAHNIEVVGEAADGRATIELSNELEPDVVVMDIRMPNLSGIEATRQIRSSSPNVKIMALSAFTDRRTVLEMLEAGASGYIQKSAAGEELVRAIQAVSQGKSYLSPEVAHTVVDSYMDRIYPSERSTLSNLGAREREVLQMLSEGKSSKEIAVQLHLSSRTVETHRRNIMKKLNLHNVAELTRYAIREGLISVD